MKKTALLLLLALTLASGGALAEGRSFALNRERSSDIYAWDGTVLTEPGEYIYIYPITDGMAAAEDELFAAQSATAGGAALPARFAILDAKGRRLTDYLFDSVWYSQTGDVLITSIDGKYGAMSRSMQELVSCDYDCVVPDGEGGFLLLAHSDDATAPVLRMAAGGTPEETGVRARFYVNADEITDTPLLPACDESGLYGLLRLDGKWAVRPRFEWIQSFVGRYAIARENGRVGVINADGQWKIRPTYDDDRGMLPGGDAVLLMRGLRVFAVRTSDGKQLFTARLSDEGYASASSYRPVFSVTDRGRCTLYDEAGREILSIADGRTLDLWSKLPEDRFLALAPRDNLLMDGEGRELLRVQSLITLSPLDGRALFQTARFKTRMVQYPGDDAPSEEPIYATYRYGLADADGRELLPMVYTQLDELIPGRYYAKDARRWGVIDENGQWIISGSLYDQLMD